MSKELLQPVPPENSQTPLFRRTEIAEDTVRIETKEGIFNIVYSRHDLPNNPEIIDGADGLILELRISEEFVEAPHEGIFFGRPQYQELLRETFKQGKPVFLPDLVCDNKTWQDIRYRDGMIFAVEVFLGATVLFKNQIFKPKKISRRDFLGKGLRYGTGLYLAGLPILSLVGDVLLEIQEKRTGTVDASSRRQFDDLFYSLHPELRHPIKIEARNHLLAQKAATIASALGQKLQHKPQFVFPVGAAHYGIEDSFQLSPEERIQKLWDSLGEDFEKQGIIIEARFEPNKDVKPIKFSVSPFNGKIHLLFHEDPSFRGEEPENRIAQY